MVPFRPPTPLVVTVGSRWRAFCSLFGAQVRACGPEALGLPATSGRSNRVTGRARTQLTEALITGDEALQRQITIDLYLAQHSTGVTCNDVFAAAFREIGNRWSLGNAEIYQERRVCRKSVTVAIVLPGRQGKRTSFGYRAPKF